MFFFLGGGVTIAINWWLFKDPKRVTAPGVSVFLASCTFALALYSASQVKKWLNSKVNEKAFKRTEEFLDEISNQALLSAKLQHLMYRIKNQKKFSNQIFSNINDELEPLLKDLSTSNTSQTLKTYTFAHWQVRLKGKQPYQKAKYHYDKFITEGYILSGLLKGYSANEKHHINIDEHTIESLQHQRKNISLRIDTYGYIIDGLMKMSYTDFFEHLQNKNKIIITLQTR